MQTLDNSKKVKAHSVEINNLKEIDKVQNNPDKEKNNMQKHYNKKIKTISNKYHNLLKDSDKPNSKETDSNKATMHMYNI